MRSDVLPRFFFLVLRSSDYQFSIYPQSQFVKTAKRGNWNLITIYSRERVLSKFSTYSKFVCKNILADSASLLRILSKSILRPVLRKILTIFLNAWNAWVLSSFDGNFCNGAPRRIVTKFGSSSLVIHWFSSSHVCNFSSPSKLSRRFLKCDSLPVWTNALEKNRKKQPLLRLSFPTPNYPL